MKRSILTLTVTAVTLFIMAAAACGPGKGTKADNPGHNNNPAPAGAGQKAEALLVTVKRMTYEQFHHFFQASGSVEAVNDAFISPEINGRIKKIHVKEGQRVSRGQLLVTLNPEVIESSAAEVKSSLELAKTVYKKRKGLWDKKIGSEIQYLQAKTNKESLENRLKTLEAQLKMTKIKAPISGIVDDIFRKEGELAVPGLQLIQLINLDKVYINAEVSEAYLAKVARGDEVAVKFPSYPGLKLNAVIHRTGNVVNPQNRTFRVQLLLDNIEEKLKPNMLALIDMKDFSSDSALVVPSIIVKNDLKGSYLYIMENKAARKVYVKPGISEGSSTMIREGLEPGQQVIVKGYNLVKNGMAVKTEAES